MIKVEMDPGPRRDKIEGQTERKREHGFYIVTEDGVSHPIPIGFMRISECKTLESLLNQIIGSQERVPALDVEAVIKDLHDQEVYAGNEHPLLIHSPDQIRKTLTRFVKGLGSIKWREATHETVTPRREVTDQRRG